MIIPAKYSNPVLTDKYIQYLQTELDKLSWLEYVYPAVRVGVDENGLTFPMVYANDGTNRNYSVLFDTDAKAYSFFEYAGDVDISDGNFNGGDATISIPLSVIVWGRLDAINPVKKYDYTSELVEDVLSAIKDAVNYNGYGMSSLTGVSYTMDYDRVFQRYTLHNEAEMQALMRVRTAFRVDFTVIVDSDCDIA